MNVAKRLTRVLVLSNSPTLKLRVVIWILFADKHMMELANHHIFGPIIVVLLRNKVPRSIAWFLCLTLHLTF